jgi:hypothetical protein
MVHAKEGGGSEEKKRKGQGKDKDGKMYLIIGYSVGARLNPEA